MKKINTLLCALAIVSYSHIVYAQAPANAPQPTANVNTGNSAARISGQVSGTVVDASNGEEVPYATVTLKDPATDKMIYGAVADMDGKFIINKIEPGTYKVVISFVGYQEKVVSTITVSNNKPVHDLGAIQLAPVVKQLNEIVVETQRNLIEEKVDRTVYNAENDETNKGGDASDVLRKVPMLSVDMDGNVSLRGSQNIRVLINNRPSTITAGSIADALKQIPSDMIKSVEVITSPSAKYDAEGSAGIININLKKNTLEGFSLNTNASAGLRGSNLGLNGSLRTGKMSFSLGGFGRAGYNTNGEFQNLSTTRNPAGADENQVTNTQEAETRNRHMFGRYQLGWDYDINKRNFMNASVSYGLRNMNMFQDDLFTQTFQNTALIGRSLRDVNIADLSGTVDVNLGYTHTFEKPQQELSILTQYSRNNRTNDFVNNVLSLDDQTIMNRLKNENQSFNQETTIQLDYQTPIGKTQMIEVGAKEIMRKVSSDFQYLFAEGANGAFMPDQNRQRGNVFDYNQNVTAGYASYTLTAAKVYSLKAGARYEYTTIGADFKTGESLNIPSYGALVPSINLSRKMKNGSMVKAAYNRRLQRPSLQFLNPNIQAPNPLNVTIGNPNLEQEFTNNFELGYNTYFKGISLSLTTFMRNTNNAIQAVRDVIGQDTIRTTYANIGREDAYGFSLFANINLSNKFSLNGGTDMYYAVLNNNVPNPLYTASNQGWVANIRGFANYTIAKGWGLQAFGFYRGSQVQLQGTQGGFGIYSLNLRKEFHEKRGSIGIGAENFFNINGFKMQNELNSPIITQQSTNTMYNMNFKVNFSYRIGKLSTDGGSRRRRKSINNDDMKDGGSDNAATVGQAQGGGAAPVQGGGAPAQGGGAPGGQMPAGAPGQRPQGVMPGQGQRPGGMAPNGQAPAQRPGQSGQASPEQAKPQQEEKETEEREQPEEQRKDVDGEKKADE
jgi:outer membrane receptor protein involved in Fe transport